jgi:hypothetical protein
MISKLLLFSQMMLKGKMRIPISHRYISVTNHLLRFLQPRTRENKIRTKSMSQIMEMKILYPSNTKNPPPSLIKTLQGRAIEMAKDVIRIDLNDFSSVPHILKMSLPLQDSFLCSRHQKLSALLLILGAKETNQP